MQVLHPIPINIVLMYEFMYIGIMELIRYLDLVTL